MTTAGKSTERGVAPARRRLALPLLIVTLDTLAAIGYIALALRNGPGRVDASTLAFAVLPFTGAVIIYKQPRNLVGWALALLGWFNIFSNLVGEYGYYALVTHPGSLPLGGAAAWFNATWWLAVQPLTVAAVLLFPDGRPPARPWWALLAVTFAIALPLYAFTAILLWNFRGPALLTPDILATLGSDVWGKFQVVAAIWSPVFVGGMALAVIAQAFRFARSRGVERLQLKWILLAMGTAPVAIGVSMISLPKEYAFLSGAIAGFNVLSVIAFPIAMAFAITRYHLYDIDLIIRRTLLYAALTIALGLLYFGSVVLLQTAISDINRGESPVSVVLSTLLIAALFSPLRARFQRIIDKRFYRSQYNSEQILEHFSAGLRAEVDLDAVNGHLLDAVEKSLQPEHCALWLVRK